MKRESNSVRDASGPKRTVLRDNLESIAIAVLLVLFMRQLVVEAFKIPTGSMAPALVGIHREVRCPNCGHPFRVGHDKVGGRGEVICPNCEYQWRGSGNSVVRGGREDPILFQRPPWLWHRGRTAQSRQIVSGADAANRVDRSGSRIFVNKFVYRLRPPRRWELVVFKFPYGDKNYIKRLIGLPGERVSIRDGDLYIDGRIARKPPRIQAEMWMHVLDTARPPLEPVVEWWDFGGRPDRWDYMPETGRMRVDARGASSPLYARYAGTIRDFYAYDGFGNIDGNANRSRVDDVRIKADVRPGEDADERASIELRAAGGDHDFRVRIPVSGAEEAVIFDGGRKVMAAAAPELTAGRRHVLSVERYDQSLIVSLDGRVLMEYLHDTPAVSRNYEQFVGLGATGLTATFDRVRLSRDVHYLSGNGFGDDEWALDESSYFVLGDNSPYSSDSRQWESHEVPARNLIGRAFAVFWPISDITFLPAGEPRQHD